MRTAVVIGGRGQSGRAIAGRLVEAGWEVTATTSGPQPAGADSRIRWVSLARDAEGQAGDLRRVVGAGVDVVVDVVAYTPAHARQLVDLGDAVGAAIVLSTLGVYSDEQGRSLDGASEEASFPAWPVPIPEDWMTVAPGEATYSTRKAAIEQLLRERAPWPVTIIRPGAIHGPYSRHLREWYFAQRVRDRRRRVVLAYDGSSVFQPTATTNLAELVALAADRPADRVLNCGDANPPTVARISEIVDALMGWATERVLVSGPPPAPGVGDHPWAVPRPVVADMARASAELGYRDVANYQEALAPTLAWAREAVSERDWREIFPTMAGYPDDPFDYAAEDAYLDRREAASRTSAHRL
ncbi:MAG: NAD-dependent epimerase/dehydratase family protein [Acidimicrobiales bacterium]